jgi:ATP-binding cassette, subfamily B, bacterial PglK
VSVLRQTLALLNSAERRRAGLLLGMILFMALFDVVGVASIMPFMAVLANPEIIQTNRWLAMVYDGLGFQESEKFLFFLGVMVLCTVVFSTAFRALTTYVLLRFTHMREYSLGRRLVSGYLSQPYEWFLGRHSADLGKTVLSEVQQVIKGALIPMMQLVAHGAVVLAILILLILVHPVLAISVGLALGGAYVGIYVLLRRRLARLGKARLAANRARFQTLIEAFGGIKDVKVSGLEEAFLSRYNGPARRFASHQAASQVAAQLPKYLLESIAFGGMLLVVLYLMRTSDGLQTALPMIALYGFASYRLMPALQHVYVQFSHLRFAQAALAALHRDLTSLAPAPKHPVNSEPLRLTQAIRLVDVTYSYPGASRPSITGLNLEIQARTTIGLVGATGSGKTTTVDIILGLLSPRQGQLLIDDVQIGPANVRSWQRAIGYVPQNIYLSDDSVTANIAFGIPPQQIDQAAVEQAARIANLHDFVSGEMPQGYQTLVGERGVRLSGGQRQRIGIARALYHRPQILILDEATSALDNLTEQGVMEAVHSLSHEITIILIAHRLSTVRQCDRIYLLQKGQLAGFGTYDELVASNATFREMAQAAVAI